MGPYVPRPSSGEPTLRVRRIEAVIRFVGDPETSSRPPGRLVTPGDDGNIVGVIDRATGGMPGRRA